MDTRIRVGGIWISDNAVLLESFADGEIWGIPGGGLEDDESLEDGVRREFREETGLEVRCASLAIINENFWDARDANIFLNAQDTSIREYGFYFWVSTVSSVAEPRPFVRSLEDHIKFGWFDLGELKTVAIAPSFLNSVLPILGNDTLFIKSSG